MYVTNNKKIKHCVISAVEASLKFIFRSPL